MAKNKIQNVDSVIFETCFNLMYLDPSVDVQTEGLETSAYRCSSEYQQQAITNPY